MENSRTPRTSYLRVAHEFLFSFNLGLVARLTMAYANYYSSELKLQLWFNRRLHLHPHSNVGGIAAVLLLALLITFYVFLLLRVSSGISLTRAFLLYVAGIVSAVALPFSCLYHARLYGQLPGVSDLPHILLFLELAAIAAFAILYVLSKWPFPAWSTVILLILHFGFWGWVFLGGPYFWLAPFKLTFPLAGFASTVAWGLYVSLQRTEPRLTINESAGPS